MSSLFTVPSFGPASPNVCGKDVAVYVIIHCGLAKGSYVM